MPVVSVRACDSRTLFIRVCQASLTSRGIVRTIFISHSTTCREASGLAILKPRSTRVITLVDTFEEASQYAIGDGLG